MSTLAFGFALALLGGCCVLVENRSYYNGLIFYDLQTHQALLPPKVTVSRGYLPFNAKRSDKESIWSKTGELCNCEGIHCGCCAGIKLNRFNFDRKMCVNIGFVPSKEEIGLDISFNDERIAKYALSARNPSPLCVPIMLPIPTSICFQLSNVAIQGNNLNMCMDAVVRVATATAMELHFQCMKMGLDGLQYVDKNGQPVIPPSSSKVEEAATTLKADPNDEDYYDEENAIDNESENDNENVAPSESVANTFYAATAVQQQQTIQEQMQQLQQSLATLQPAPAEMEIEQESEMSSAGTTTVPPTTYEDAEAANVDSIGSDMASTEPQPNEIIAAITLAPTAATSAVPLTATISLDSFEQLADAATDTVALAATPTEAATTAAAILAADTKVEATTAGEAAGANADNDSSDNSIDGDDDEEDGDEDGDVDESNDNKIDVDADAAGQEDYDAEAEEKDNYEADASTGDASAEAGSVSEVENLSGNVAPAAPFIGETESEAMASAADNVAVEAATATATTTTATAAQESEAANVATPHAPPPLQLMARYRQRYG